MDEKDSASGIPLWLVKRKKTETVLYSTKYTEEQCAELELIKSLYLSLCFQYEPVKDEQNYLIFFRLREKYSRFFELGYCPITDFRYWQSLLDPTSVFYHSFQSIFGYLCAAQLSVNQRLDLQGYSYDPSTMVFEEIKSWVIKLSKLKIVGVPLRDELSHRKQLFFEASAHPDLFKELPEFAEALYKCGFVIDNELLPYVNATLTQYYVQKPFLSFKKCTRELLDSLVRFIFYVFRDTEYVAWKCSINDLQDPFLRDTKLVGKECENTVSGKLLLKLITSAVMQEVFQDDPSKGAGYNIHYENSFINEEGSIQFPKEWNASSEKKISATPVGILSIFKNDIKLMQRFIELHALTQKMATFYVIFQAFIELKQDCRYVLKEMRDVIQHYKALYSEWGKCIRELYAKAGSYLVKAKYIKGHKETECWKRNFYEVLNGYDSLIKNLSLSRAAVHEFEGMCTEMEPIPRLHRVSESLEKFLELMNYFTEKLKPAPLHGESRELLLSPSTPQRGSSAPGSRVGTPKKIM